jgi:hypothetical protein
MTASSEEYHGPRESFEDQCVLAPNFDHLCMRHHRMYRQNLSCLLINPQQLYLARQSAIVPGLS